LILQFLIGLAGALIFLDVGGVPDIIDVRINDTVSLFKQLSYLQMNIGIGMSIKRSYKLQQ
jgi:hypothetical protein